MENASNEGTAQVFLALSGRPMKASDVGSQIGSCWEKVFGNGSGAGGATAFAKQLCLQYTGMMLGREKI